MVQLESNTSFQSALVAANQYGLVPCNHSIPCVAKPGLPFSSFVVQRAAWSFPKAFPKAFQRLSKGFQRLSKGFPFGVPIFALGHGYSKRLCDYKYTKDSEHIRGCSRLHYIRNATL